MKKFTEEYQAEYYRKTLAMAQLPYPARQVAMQAFGVLAEFYRRRAAEAKTN